MPPKKKGPRFTKPARAQRPRQAGTSPAPEEDESPARSPPDPEGEDTDPAAPSNFFNTTFSTHRVSPLFVGQHGLGHDRLATLAHRLRDILVGDVVRGVEVGVEGEDSAMGRAGSLEKVEMRWVELSRLLGPFPSLPEEGRPENRDLSSDAVAVPGGGGFGDPQALDGDGLRRIGRARVLRIVLQYENTTGTALLLPAVMQAGRAGTDSADYEDLMLGDTDRWPVTGQPRNGTGSSPADKPDSSHFLRLPLLLLRTPAPLKPVIIEFLSTTFDCRISSLRLGTRSIVRAWEAWLRDSGPPRDGPLVKDAVLTLGFYLPPSTDLEDDAEGKAGDNNQEEIDGNTSATPRGPGLKSIDIIIPQEDLRRLVKAGNAIERERLSQHHTTSEAADRSKRKEAPHGQGRAPNDFSAQKRRKLAGGHGEEGWDWRQPPPHRGDDTRRVGKYDDAHQHQHQHQMPFLAALGRYADHHLGLKIFHPGVRLTRIACGGFVISEGRVKVFAPPDRTGGLAALSLVGDLVGRAGGPVL